MDIDGETIEAAQSIIAFLTTVVGLMSLMFKFIRDNKKGGIYALDEIKSIETIDKIDYENIEAKSSLKKSLLFRALTGKAESIRKIKLIMECHDPGMAIYIYTQAPNYIKVRKGISGYKLAPPHSLSSHLDDFFLNVFAICGCIGLAADYAFISLVVSNASSIQPLNGNIFASIFIIVVFLSFTMLTFRYMLVFSQRELKLLEVTRRFYSMDARLHSHRILCYAEKNYRRLDSLLLFPRRRRKS